MKKFLFLLVSILCGQYAISQDTALRAPAYPLITIDPYISSWSHSDFLYGDVVRHWTGTETPLSGFIKVDDTIYRFLGKENIKRNYVLDNSQSIKWKAQYTYQTPDANWCNCNFDDSKWLTGFGAFGTSDKPYIGTEWSNEDIWIRREFNIEDTDIKNKKLFLIYSHDDVFELYINGKQIVNTGLSWNDNVIMQLDRSVNDMLKEKGNIIAAHCHNTSGGAYVDFGIFTEDEINSKITNAIQANVNLTPIQTSYSFYCGPVELNIKFTSPLILNDLKLLSTPINYISYNVKSTDNNKHDVEIFFSASPKWAVNSIEQEVSVENFKSDNLNIAKAGTSKQKVLGKSGDIICIDWGYFYLSGKEGVNCYMATGDNDEIFRYFVEKNGLQENDTKIISRVDERNIAMAYSEKIDLNQKKNYEGFIMIGYDDIESIQYFKQNLKAYWKKYFSNIEEALKFYQDNYDKIIKKCNSWDNTVMEDAVKAGGKQYAEICAVSYRQAVAAHKLVVSQNDKLFFFSKENNSNGSIGTVDVTYPSCPLFLRYNTDIMKGMLEFIFEYSESGRWTKPFPAHDVGTYPLANGQTYLEDMPVEEAGNMIIMTAAIAAAEGHAEYAKEHWTTLTTWADYLVEKGMDPENQLCTEDFAGHLAHNANLSAKAIMGIACYGYLAEMLNIEKAKEYTDKAKEMAEKWVKIADDGDHYRLAFDKPGTWSQKYNFVWDKVLDMNILPEKAMEKEIGFYTRNQNKYGLPLDNRFSWSKIDDTVWVATMADNNTDFHKLINPLWMYVNETPSRVPLGDWHNTITGEYINFRARSVVGGVFMKSLEYFIRNK